MPCCIFHYSYNADTDSCHAPHQTDAIASVTDFYFTEISGYHSYAFVTPPHYDSIDGRSSSDSNIIYWKSSVDNEDDNVDTTGVLSYQRCYELCQVVNEGFCWVFRWVWRHTARTDCHDLKSQTDIVIPYSFMTSGGRCVIPQLSVSALTSSVRLSLIREDESGAETYMFNPESVNNGKCLCCRVPCIFVGDHLL